MKTSKIAAVGAMLAASALAHAPAAVAGMQIGNYEVRTQKDSGHSWLWEVRQCGVDQITYTPDCVHVQASPRPNGQATPWRTDAQLVNGRYTLAVDIPDGVRCTIYFLPSHDVWSWDMVSLQGSVDSSFDKGCGNAPGGTVSYPFQLQRY